MSYSVPWIHSHKRFGCTSASLGHSMWPLSTPIRSSDCACCSSASWKFFAHHPHQVLTLLTVDTRYQSPRCDDLHLHLYQCCVTLCSLHPNDHGEFSHILSSCQVYLWMPESCLGDKLGARPGTSSSPACPRGEQLVLINLRQGWDMMRMVLCLWGETPRARKGPSYRSICLEEGILSGW